MPGAGSTPDRSQPRPDDINDRLAEVAAELAAEAKFKEPSAAMRGRVAPGSGKDGPAGPIRRPGPFRNWRNKRAAARLRKPVQPAGHPAAAKRRRAAAGRRTIQAASLNVTDGRRRTSLRQPKRTGVIRAAAVVHDQQPVRWLPSG